MRAAAYKRLWHVLIWLAINRFIVRPRFAWMNFQAYNESRCRMAYGTEGHGPGSNSTGLDVIVASMGSTGSTTVHFALDALGVRTWGFEEGMTWSNVIFDKLHMADWTGPRSAFKRCGVRAIVSDFAYLKVTMAALPFSPDAKLVILTKPYKSWLRSKANTLTYGVPLSFISRLLLHEICNWLPYGLVWPLDVGGSLNVPGIDPTVLLHDVCVAWERFGGMTWRNPDRGATFDREMADLMASEEAYNEMHRHVQSLVEPGRFQEVDIRNLTWEEVSSWVGLPPPASGPLPRSKSYGLSKLWIRLLTFRLRALLFFSIMASTIAANWLVYRAIVSVLLRLAGKVKLA